MTPARLRSLLRRLGATPERIAFRLMQRGIRGQINHAEECPVARYLARHGAIDPCVDAQRITCNTDVEIQTPGAVVDFILQFYDGRWPELAAKPSGEPA
jgi:hypothetical protein